MEGMVLLTGCFDILHQAHLDFLKAAKKQGKILVVGLETDQRVRQLKGKGRPINNWDKRAQTLASLNIVDYIFSLPRNIGQNFAQIKLLTYLKPKVLALSKSTSFLKEKRRITQKLGIKLFIFPNNPQYSTSKLLALDKASPFSLK